MSRPPSRPKSLRSGARHSFSDYRQEHRLEIDASASEESEETSTAEISNPNDEIPVTYLFYELQRTWDVSERIHDLVPVVLVAQDVLRADEIDEEWLLANDWVLRRAILDDSFVPALDYLSKGFVGDEVAAEVQRNHLSTQLGVVAQVGQQVKVGASALGKAQEKLSEAVEAYARTQIKGGGGFLSSVGSFMFGSGPDVSEAVQVRLDAAKEAFDRAEREQATLRARLESELTALQVATDNDARTMEQMFNRRTEINRLRAHVKENILYYMQAIWDHEPPDQRFFRLYQLDVPDIEVTPAHKATVRFGVPSLTDVASAAGAGLDRPIHAELPRPTPQFTTRKLVEVADLDNLLGFKGNYAIFPMKAPNAITAFMMQDYLEVADDKVRARDPDELARATTGQLLALARLDGVGAERANGARRDALRSALVDRWTSPVAERDTVVVPTRALYIEALPGRHPVLEDCKLVHRAVDVKKVQAEVRKAELENVRLAVRALEGQLEDPDVEKKVVIEGTGAVIVPPGDA